MPFQSSTNVIYSIKCVQIYVRSGCYVLVLLLPNASPPPSVLYTNPDFQKSRYLRRTNHQNPMLMVRSVQVRWEGIPQTFKAYSFLS